MSAIYKPASPNQSIPTPSNRFVIYSRHNDEKQQSNFPKNIKIILILLITSSCSVFQNLQIAKLLRIIRKIRHYCIKKTGIFKTSVAYYSCEKIKIETTAMK